MDRNKLKVLKDIGYSIQNCCALCLYSEFPNDDWGTCSKHSYEHEKHSDSERELSIHKLGSCPDFDMELVKKQHLGGFAELLKDTA